MISFILYLTPTVVVTTGPKTVPSMKVEGLEGATVEGIVPLKVFFRYAASTFGPSKVFFQAYGSTVEPSKAFYQLND